MDDLPDYEQFIEGLSKEAVDKELTKHPEYISQEERLFKKKKAELEHRIEERSSKTAEELQKAGAILIQWVLTLPEAEREKVTAQIVKINQKIASDDHIIKRFISGELNLQKLLNVEDSLVEEIYKLALRLQHENNYLDAAALFKFLIILNPYMPDFWIGLGFSFLHLHELEEAQNYFDTAISMDTLNPRGYYFASLCSKLRKEPQKALNFCEVGISLGSADWDDSFSSLKQSLGGSNGK